MVGVAPGSCLDTGRRSRPRPVHLQQDVPPDRGDVSRSSLGNRLRVVTAQPVLYLGLLVLVWRRDVVESGTHTLLVLGPEVPEARGGGGALGGADRVEVGVERVQVWQKDLLGRTVEDDDAPRKVSTVEDSFEGDLFVSILVLMCRLLDSVDPAQVAEVGVSSRPSVSRGGCEAAGAQIPVASG